MSLLTLLIYKDKLSEETLSTNNTYFVVQGELTTKQIQIGHHTGLWQTWVDATLGTSNSFTIHNTPACPAISQPIHNRQISGINATCAQCNVKVNPVDK